MGTIVLFKVPREIKEKMKKYKVDWSKILRDFLIEKIREFEAYENIEDVR